MPESLVIHAHRLEAGQTVSALWHSHSHTSFPSNQYAISSLNTLITSHEARLHLIYVARHHNLSAFTSYGPDIEKLKIGLEIFRDARRLFHAEALRHSRQAPGQSLESYSADLEKLLRAQAVLDGCGKLVMGIFMGLDMSVQCAVLEMGKTFLQTSLSEFIGLVKAAKRSAADARLPRVDGWTGIVLPKKRRHGMSSETTAVGSEDYETLQGRNGAYAVEEGRKRIKTEKVEQARKILPLPQRFHQRRESVVEAYKRAARNLSGSGSTGWDSNWAVYRKRKAELEEELHNASALVSTPTALHQATLANQNLNKINTGDAYVMKPEAAYQVPMSNQSAQKENFAPIQPNIPPKSNAVKKDDSLRLPPNDWVVGLREGTHSEEDAHGIFASTVRVFPTVIGMKCRGDRFGVAAYYRHRLG